MFRSARGTGLLILTLCEESSFLQSEQAESFSSRFPRIARREVDRAAAIKLGNMQIRTIRHQILGCRLTRAGRF